jgi:hypothetical protein
MVSFLSLLPSKNTNLEETNVPNNNFSFLKIHFGYLVIHLVILIFINRHNNFGTLDPQRR